MPMDERKAWLNKDGTYSLECSTKGDIRFSAFGATIELFGHKATIEQHYQLSKRFLDKYGMLYAPKSIYDVKGKNSKVTNMEFAWIVVNDKVFPIDFRMEFYKWMWLQYLDQNPDLVKFAEQFDDFNDIFKGKSIICQADCIRQYIKQGRLSMVDDVLLFTKMLGVDKCKVFLGI